MKIIKPLLYVVLSSFILKAAFGYIRACIYTNWSQFSRSNVGRFTPAKIPTQLCTHIVFAYADIRGTNITTTEFNDIRMFSRLNSLRRENPNLNLNLAIGGWAAGGEKFSRLVSSNASMEQFADKLVSFLRRYSFDGAVIDWEYPGSQTRRNGLSDRLRFTQFLQILASRFSGDANATGNQRLTLSAAVEVNVTEARTFYEIDKIGRLLDYAYVMAYDIHGAWDPSPGALHHSALHPDISDFIEGWVASGFPASKIVLGMTAFGRSFTLASSPIGTGLGQRVRGGGTPGLISRTRGMLDFGEICINLQRQGWQREWLEEQGVPIAFGNTTAGWQWVGYDDYRSVALKAKYVRQNNLAGVMLWSLDHEDHSNICGTGTWPLLRTLASELPRSRPTLPETTHPPTREETTAVTTSDTEKKMTQDSNSISTSTNDVKTATTTAASRTNLPKKTIHQRADSMPETKDEAALSTFPSVEWKSKSSFRDNPGYTQCQMSQTIGAAMRCPPNRGKPGDRHSFYLFCANGFFGILCHCLPGHFYNRCISMCDLEQNFLKCPLVY